MAGRVTVVPAAVVQGDSTATLSEQHLLQHKAAPVVMEVQRASRAPVAWGRPTARLARLAMAVWGGEAVTRVTPAAAPSVAVAVQQVVRGATAAMRMAGRRATAVRVATVVCPRRDQPGPLLPILHRSAEISARPGVSVAEAAAVVTPPRAPLAMAAPVAMAPRAAQAETVLTRPLARRPVLPAAVAALVGRVAGGVTAVQAALQQAARVVRVAPAATGARQAWAVMAGPEPTPAPQVARVAMGVTVVTPP